MIGFSLLTLLMVALTWLVAYWISWEIQDSRTRPTFAAQFRSDRTRLLGRNRLARSPGISTIVVPTNSTARATFPATVRAGRLVRRWLLR